MANTRIDKSLRKEMTEVLFEMREDTSTHLSIDQEYQFYNAVASGNKTEVLELFKPLNHSQMGRLSDNPVNNIRYHLVITIAMITRFCIEHGLEKEAAYSISDHYIRQADKCQTTKEINKLHKDSVLEFTRAMKTKKKESITSLPVLKVYEYVEKHLHDKIVLDKLCSSIGVSKTYLCALFKKETGMTLGNYIMNQKINSACDLLSFTEYTPLDISNFLAFSSLSHFIKTFKEHTGMTPVQYRKLNYEKHFNK